MPKSRGFLVGTFYRAPNSSNHHDKEFMVKLDNVLGNTLSEGKEVIITGDFNCDFLPNRTQLSECKHLKALLHNLNFKQLINEGSRITQNSSTLTSLVSILVSYLPTYLHLKLFL